MGIESDRLVFDYLSRVGDLAQQRQLPSSTRMRLVAELRDEIDRHRARASADTPASVRRILTRLGDPDDLVSGAGGRPAADGTPLTVPEQRGPDAPAPSPSPSPRPSPRPSPFRSRPRSSSASPPPSPSPEKPAPPEGPTGKRAEKPTEDGGPEGPGGKPTAKGLWRLVRPRTGGKPVPARDAPAPGGHADGHRPPAPPHLAPLDELGSAAGPRDWWRKADSGPYEAFDSVPGFVGGIEIPEILKPPPAAEGEGEDEEQDGAAGGPEDGTGTGPDAAEASEATGKGRRGGLALALLTGWSSPLLLVAAALLVVGAVLGNLLALAGGWALAWLSKRLSPAESKFAVLWLPGLALAGGVAWLWGRMEGRWGRPIAEGAFDQAVEGTWPWVLKSAAVASAVFLVWRSRRKG
ncbi:hypothetical protein JNUCC64_14255 [Streptomyces sp. JNUCC 64]